MNNLIYLFFGGILFIYLPFRLITGLIKPQKYNKTNRKDIVTQVLASWAVVFLLLMVAMMFTEERTIEASQTERIEQAEQQSVSQVVTESQADEKIATANQIPSPKKEPPKVDYSKVIMPYTKEWAPKLYDAWGKEWVDKINKMMPLAVDKMVLEPRCDEPEMIDLSDNRSIVKQEAVFFVDCKNGERFYVSQRELNIK